MHGVTLRGLVVGDEPGAWERAGFDVSGDRLSVDGVTIHLVGEAGSRGIIAWSLDHPSPRTVDGLIHDDVGDPAPPATHPNGAGLVDHVVVGTSDMERTTAALAELGIHPRRTVTGIRQGDDSLFRFFLLGTCLLEVIGPTEPSGSGRPARFWGIAFVVDDLDATSAALGDRCGEPHDAIQPGRRIASLRHEDVGISVPVAFMTPRAGR